MRKLTSAIKVQPVIARADEKLFLSVPQRVYAGDRHWVPPLHSHVAKKFAQSCPFLRHGKLQRFIVLAPGKRSRAEAVGRIVAGVDYNLAGEDATVGLIGFLRLY